MKLVHTKFNGYGPDGRRLYFKGSKAPETPQELKDLYAEQAASARMLRNQAEQYLPGAVQGYVGQVNAVTDPGYANRQAGLVAADMASANGMERAATERNLASMGVNPNDARFAGGLRSAGLNNAARMSAGQNAARNDASRYQLAVAQDAVGTFTGQSNSAAAQMANTANGMSAMHTNQQNLANQHSANQQNAIGSAIGGGMAAYGLYKSKDGGKVPAPAGLRGKVLEHHFGGGMAGSQQRNPGFFQMQQIAPPPVQPAAPGADPIGQALGTANQIKAGKDAYDVATIGVKSQQAAAPVVEAGGATPAGWAANPAPQAAAEAAAAEAGTGALAEAGTGALAEAGTGALAEAGTGALAEGGTSLLTAGGAGSAAMAALPWVGAAYGVGKLLELWADGGEVGTQTKVHDLRAGAKVPGNWTENRDTVPAMLVEEEHVLNAEASKLVGHDDLDKLNAEGLKLRKQGQTPDTIKKIGLRRALA